jgi:hypothetical protein
LRRYRRRNGSHPISSLKPVIAHLDQFVTGQDLAKRLVAAGVSNQFKRVVETPDPGDPDPFIVDPKLKNVRIEKSDILLNGIVDPLVTHAPTIGPDRTVMRRITSLTSSPRSTIVVVVLITCSK